MDPATKESQPPRVVVLVVASEHIPAYAGFRAAWRTYVRLFEPDARCRFVDMDPRASQAVREDAGSCALVVRGSEAERMDGVPSVLLKTLAALRHLVDQGTDFDYVVRTNLSSFLRLDRLLDFVRTLPRSGVARGVIHTYAGDVNGRAGRPFTSGACSIWSPDVVHYLLAEDAAGRVDHTVPDDVAIGACLAERFALEPLPRIEIDGFPLDPEVLDDETFHVRTKSADRFADVQVHLTLLERYYGARLRAQRATRSLGLVTFYLELPGGERGRGPAFYAQHAAALFASTSLPIVCYVEEAHVDRFRSCVPPGANIELVSASWSELPTAAYVERIRSNRVRDGTIGRRRRSTPEYFALVSAKWHFLERAMDANPFDVSHFGWIDIGIAHATTANDLRYLDAEIAAAVRDRIRICQIHRRPPTILRDPEAFYRPERFLASTFAAGFFTAREDVMRVFGAAVHATFVETVARGFGDGEEAVIATVYGRHPEWFDWYHGDYYGVLANYASLQTDVACVLRFFVEEAVEQGAYAEARRACSEIHAALERGGALEPPQLARLYRAWLVSAWHVGGPEAEAECATCLLRLESLALRPFRLPEWELEIERVRSGAELD